MTLTVDVLPTWPVHLVRARVAEPDSWTLHGQADGRSGKVAEGVGPVWLSDPWAPLGLQVDYMLSTAAGTVAAGPVVRSTASRQNIVTDLRGKLPVQFAWTRAGGGRREYDTGRHGFFPVPGRALSPYVAAPSAGAGGGALVARVDGVAANETMERLVLAGQPLILLHNEQACQRAVCDIPRVQTVLLSTADQDLTARQDDVQRDWGLTFQLVPTPWGFIPPVATLEEL